MHYSEAGNAVAKSGVHSTYEQEIEVMNRADGLYIRHHFSGLSDVRHEIVWPEMSVKRTCYLEDATACTRLDEDATAFVEGEKGEQSISYVIPKDGSMEIVKLFKSIFVTLHNAKPSSTYFHLTDEIGLGGQWVNGLKLVGDEKMDLVDYSFFRGHGEVVDLYWQQEAAPLLYSGDKLTVFGFGNEENIEQYEEADIAFKALGIPHYTIVMDSGKERVNSSRFFVKETIEGERIADTILVNNIYKQFLIESDNEEQLTAEIIATLLSGKEVGSSRTKEVYQTLLDTLTESEIAEFTEILKDMKEEPINTAVLDEVIEVVTGFRTSFFTNNNHVNNPLYPFLFEEPRTVYIDGEESLESKVILKDGKTFYPGIQIMQELGFDVTQNDRSLYIESATKKYRFPLAEPFYVYNEKKYDVMAIPFERIAGEFYFEEVSLIRIFLLNIEKSAEKIDIVPISVSEGERN